MSARAITTSAVLSADGKYRYQLSRYWTRKTDPVVWIMLNPSTADAVENDPTIRRCISFAKRWGFGGIEVYNLFALRSSNPIDIERAANPVGPENDDWLTAAARSERTIIAAWGGCTTPLQSRRAIEVTELLVRGRSAWLISLGLTKTGHPRHPLYVRSDVTLSPLIAV